MAALRVGRYYRAIDEGGYGFGSGSAEGAAGAALVPTGFVQRAERLVRGAHDAAWAADVHDADMAALFSAGACTLAAPETWAVDVAAPCIALRNSSIRFSHSAIARAACWLPDRPGSGNSDVQVDVTW